MKKQLNTLVKIFLAGVAFSTAAYASEKPAPTPVSDSEKFAKYKLIVSAFKCNTASEQIGKDYLYIGNKVGARVAGAELAKALEKFKEHYDILDKSINDPKKKNLLSFVGMSYETLRETVEKPYTLDTAQEILDYTVMVSEGMRHIAELYKTEVNHHDPVNRAGLSPMIESVPKYYMAYQAGIKDKNTVSLMQETIKEIDRQINVRAKYPKNTVAMNQAMNKVERLWKVVKKFYLSIDEGGLPFIVYKTAADLRKNIAEHNRMYKELKKAELGIKK